MATKERTCKRRVREQHRWRNGRVSQPKSARDQPREPGETPLFSATQLPLVVAITTIAVDGGHMRSSTAAGLVGAAILSTLIFPFAGLALRRRSAAT